MSSTVSTQPQKRFQENRVPMLDPDEPGDGITQRDKYEERKIREGSISLLQQIRLVGGQHA